MQLLITSATLASACGGSSGGGSGDMGYGVVDPMPPPAVCPNIGPTIAASAKFEEQPDGSVVIAVRAEPSTSSDVAYIDDAPYWEGGTIISHGRVGSAWEGRLTLPPAPPSPDPSAPPASPSYSLQLPIQCKAGKDGVRLSISWKGPTKAATPLAVTVDNSR